LHQLFILDSTLKGEERHEDPLEAPEIHKPHTRHGGGLPRWLELVVAVCALVTSVSSIAIAVHNGRVMERLVEANSIPYMQGGFSDVTPEGTPLLSLDLLNRGVGPAHEESLRVKVGNSYVKSLSELISASLGSEQAVEAHGVLHAMWNRVSTRFIPGGQAQFVFRIARTAENSQYWDRLKEDASVLWDVEYCYCSVFKDCWQVLGVWREPEPVKQCRRDESREFIP
jgi:hypothetical protein